MKISRFLLIIFAFATEIALGQQTHFLEYNTQDGLAQSQVRAIAQDNSGYVWFGTLNGLSRFDGFDFKNYSTKDGLPSNQINSLHQGAEALWIGTTGAVCKKQGSQFLSSNFPDSLSQSRLQCMYEDGEGGLWIGLDGSGLLYYKDGKFTHYGENAGLRNGFIRSIKKTEDGELLLGTRAGLYTFNESRFYPSWGEQIGAVSVSDIRIINRGKLLVSTFGNGLFVIDDEEVSNFRPENSDLPNHIRSIAPAEHNEFFLGAKTGLYKLSAENGDAQKIQGLEYDNVKILFSDREANLWVGTDGKGLLQKAGEAFTLYTTADGMHSDLILSICPLDSTGLAFASYDNGIAIKHGNQLVPYPYNDQLPSKTVWALQSSPDGSLWAGTSLGLVREKNGVVELINSEKGLPVTEITSLMHRDGICWVGGAQGLAKVNDQSQVIRVFSEEDGFDGKKVRSIVQYGESVWIGAEGQLFCYADNTFKSLPINKEETTSVYSISEGPDKNIWVGTSDGLYIADSDLTQIERFDFSENISANNINFIVQLQDDQMAIGTNNGLYIIGEDQFAHYSTYEGLKSAESNQNSEHLSGENLWFGTTSGTVKFNLQKKSRTNIKAPEVNISKVELFLEEPNWKEISDSISIESGLPVDPTLPHHQNYFTFHFAGISLSNPKKVRYRYKLEGVDENWLGPTTSNTATYAYLPHGDYTFVVESFSESNPGLVSKAAFPFKITPPFYLTPWFFVFAILFVLTLLFVIYQNRIRKEREKRANLQLQFQSRLMELESQSLNSSMNRHFIFNALNSIQYYINMQDRKSANKYLTSFAKLIRKNLDSSQENQTSLKEELERLELYLSLEQMRFQGKFEYEIKIDPEVDEEAVDIPSMMLQPFLENSIWHGILPSKKFGLIRLEITSHEDHITIEITDNGIGLDASLAKKAYSNGNGHTSKGIDITQNRMTLYKRMTGLHYEVTGPINANDERGRSAGTKVIIRLPKNQNNAKAKRNPQSIWEN
ncbi:MAG: two-component regulator propeller domain-containing protein [Cryomorphaceae bacterium]|nr:histidine kinase [Flavobacteriales bacterium]